MKRECSRQRSADHIYVLFNPQRGYALWPGCEIPTRGVAAATTLDVFDEHIAYSFSQEHLERQIDAYRDVYAGFVPVKVQRTIVTTFEYELPD